MSIGDETVSIHVWSTRTEPGVTYEDEAEEKVSGAHRVGRGRFCKETKVYTLDGIDDGYSREYGNLFFACALVR